MLRSKSKYFCIVILIIIFCTVPQGGVFAEGNDTELYDSKEEFKDFIENLPEDIKALLPDGTYESLDSPEKITKLFKVEYVINISKGLFRSALSSSLKTFAFVASVSLIMAVLSAVGKAFCADGAGIKVWNLAGTLCIGASAYALVWSHIDSVMKFAENISAFIK